MTLTLSSLVKVSIAKKTSSKTFLSLYNQLDQKQPISKNEFVTSLVDNIDKSKLLLDYSLTVAASNEKRLEEFWSSFGDLPQNTQIQYLKKMSEILPSQSQIGSIKVTREILKSLINVHLIQYTNSVLSGGEVKSENPGQANPQENDLINHLIVLWCLIIQKDIHIEQFENLVSKVIQSLSEKKMDNLLKYFVKISKIRGNEGGVGIGARGRSLSNGGLKGIPKPGSNAGITGSTGSAITASKLLNVPQSAKKFVKLTQIKRSLWLYSIMSTWSTTVLTPSDFIKIYEANFFVKSSNPGDSALKKNQILLRSIILTLFQGISSKISDSYPSYVKLNWKNFIVTKLVSICNGLELSKLEIEEIIQKIMKSELESDSGDLLLKKKFVKSCIFNSVLDMSSFSKIFPNDSPTVSLNSELLQFKSSTINGSISDDFSKKLIDVNSEFTSLEESGLVQYVQSLPKQFQFSLPKQRELSKIVNKLVDDFTSRKDNDKLNRLLLSLLNDSHTLSMVFFENDPCQFIHKLVVYIDKIDDLKSSKNGGGDSGDIDGDGDGNGDFQETYSHFGVILLSIIQLAEFFQININTNDALVSVKKSFTMDYLNNFHYRLCEQLTSVLETKLAEDDETIIANYNNLISDWVRSLFDENNEDGLSDELIRSVNIKQIYKIIPLIYQQAVIAFNSGKINIKSLNNGLDYLTQLFLIPCTLSIIRWLLRYLVVGGNAKLISVLHTIIKSYLGNNTKENKGNGNLIEIDIDDDNNKDGSGIESDQVLVFKLVLNSCAQEILQTIRQLPKSNEAEEIVSLIEKNLDASFYTPNPSSIVAIKNSIKFSPIESFKSQLLDLSDSPDTSVGHYTPNVWLIDYILRFEHTNLIAFIREEIHTNYNNNNSEDIRLIFSILIYILKLKYLQNDKDKRFWEKRFSISNTKPSPSAASESDQDTAFSTSMAYHYSSIFNVPEDENLEDDLFNEHLNFDETSNASETGANTILSIKESIYRKSSFLASLIRTNSRIEDDSLKIFIQKVMESSDN